MRYRALARYARRTLEDRCHVPRQTLDENAQYDLSLVLADKVATEREGGWRDCG
jgi:hypothetical protein